MALMDVKINILTVGDKNFELLVSLVTASGVRRDIFGIRDQTMKLEFSGFWTWKWRPLNSQNPSYEFSSFNPCWSTFFPRTSMEINLIRAKEVTVVHDILYKQRTATNYCFSIVNWPKPEWVNKSCEQLVFKRRAIKFPDSSWHSDIFPRLTEAIGNKLTNGSDIF